MAMSRLWALFEDWNDAGDGPIDYYGKIAGFQSDDKYGLALFEAASFGAIDFSGGVPRDKALSSDKTRWSSEYVKKAQELIDIWYKVIDEAYENGINTDIPVVAAKSQEEYRENVQSAGRAIGMDSIMAAVAAGVPMEDIMA